MSDITCLVFHDTAGNSHKFYEAWVEGSICKVRFGRVAQRSRGGQTHEYSCDSPAAAQLKRNELVQSKLKKGYRQETVQQPDLASVAAPKTGYRIYWQAPSAILPAVLDKAVQETHELLRAIRARLGGSGWKITVEEGVGGNAYAFSYGKATSSVEFTFGYMPQGLYRSLKDGPRLKHDNDGILGYLTPSGHCVSGGVIQTDGDWVDLAARLLLVLLRGEVRDLTVTCDYGLTYAPRMLTALPADHASKFAWSAHWGTIASVLADQGLVGGSAGMDARLRKLAQSTSQPFVF